MKKLLELTSAALDDAKNIISYFDYELKDLVLEVPSSKDNHLLSHLTSHCRLEEHFDGLTCSIASFNDFDEQTLELAHSELLETGLVTKNMSLTKRITLSQNKVYKNAVNDIFKQILKELENEIMDSIIDDDESDRDGELPEDFDYVKVLEEITKDPENFEVSGFNFK